MSVLGALVAWSSLRRQEERLGVAWNLLSEEGAGTRVGAMAGCSPLSAGDLCKYGLWYLAGFLPFAPPLPHNIVGISSLVGGFPQPVNEQHLIPRQMSTYLDVWWA